MSEKSNRDQALVPVRKARDSEEIVGTFDIEQCHFCRQRVVRQWGNCVLLLILNRTLDGRLFEVDLAYNPLTFEVLEQKAWLVTESEATGDFPLSQGPATDRMVGDPKAAPPVIIGKPGDEPIVRGKKKKRLTVAQYNVVKALLDAGGEGLSKDDLADKSGHGDSVNILKRLCSSDADWESVIKLGRIPGGRYRISREPIQVHTEINTNP